MKCELLLTYRAQLKPGVEVGMGPIGNRMFFEITGGTFEGPRLRGKILTGGGDWLILDSAGVARLDVRGVFETHDGAHIYVQYPGIIVFDEKTQAALAGGPATQYGDTHWVTQPRFETGDPRYAWLNNVMAVGEGHAVPNAVEYRVFECIGG
ncbi:MAG: DUF3237 domain-containing protein [Candidatus Binatia bacterium]